MATQGLVTLTHKGKVTHKIIAGCDGGTAPRLAGLITAFNKDTGEFTKEELKALAVTVGFGCPDCLVVIDKLSSISHDGELLLHERYRETFNNPIFNPRWDRGTADHIIVVEC